MSKREFKVWRGDAAGGKFVSYPVDVEEGMVVLDAIHQIQRQQAPDLACRWNCKAAKCGSCSAEVNGKPRLMCKTRLDSLPDGEPVTVHPMRSFPIMRDLVTDVAWNYTVNRKIPPFTPKKDTQWLMQQEDVDRVQEFRKCIECFLCQNVCHVVREHDKKDHFAGPRFFCAHSQSGNASAGFPGSHPFAEKRGRAWALQHHQVLHGSLSGRNPYYRQRDYTDERTRCGPILRSGSNCHPKINRQR